MQLKSKIKLVSSSSILSFLLALYIFAYALDKRKVDAKDFTISRAIADGNSEVAGVIVFVIIGAILLLYLQYLRKFNKFYYTRFVIIPIITALFISLIYVTPYEKDGSVSKDENVNDAHAGIAIAAFLLVYTYNMLTYYIFYKKYKVKLPLFFMAFNTLILIALFIPVMLMEKEIFSAKAIETDDIKNDQIAFATFENINFLSLLFVVFLLGFYKN